MVGEAQVQGLRIVALDDDTVLDLEPLQGLWTEEQYFKLIDHSRRLLEFTDGSIERVDYAEARSPEYWIVNPVDETITVLTLVGDTYTEHGVFRRGQLTLSTNPVVLLVSNSFPKWSYYETKSDISHCPLGGKR